MEAMMLPDWLYELNDKTQKLSAPLYVVGGYLRDKILGIQSSDIDLAGPANLEIFEECVRIYPEISIRSESMKLGTLKIKYMENSCEYTCFRSDSYTNDGSHTPDSVTLGADIKEDAKRRDFTINALYYDLTKRELLDFSSGMDDIHSRTIRCIREPIEVFSEDALRILRLVRQSTQLDFSIAEKTLIGAKKCAHLLKNLAPERVQVELTLMLMADAKNSGNSEIIKGLKLCEELGVLKNLFPQLQSCRGIMQRPEYHDHDVLDHLFYSCVASKSDIISRLAALFHDIGKPVVAKKSTMHGHDKVSVDITREMLNWLRYPKKTINTVCTLINAHMYDLDSKTKPNRTRRFIAMMGYGNMEYLIDLRRADFIGSSVNELTFDPGAKWSQMLREMKQQNIPDDPNGININGRDIKQLLGEGATVEIGRMKNALWMYVINHPNCNTIDKLILQAKVMLNDEQSWNKEWQNKWII